MAAVLAIDYQCYTYCVNKNIFLNTYCCKYSKFVIKHRKKFIRTFFAELKHNSIKNTVNENNMPSR